MLLPEAREPFVEGYGASGGHIGAALTDSFFDATLGGDVHEPLILNGRLHNSLRFPVDSEYDGTARLLELFEHLDGVVSEGGERLDVLGDVDHLETSGRGILSYLLKCGEGFRDVDGGRTAVLEVPHSHAEKRA
jgi:hypothetical protein